MMIVFYFLYLMSLSVVTVNVNGIAEKPKRLKVFQALRDLNHDIYLLQETHLPTVSQGELWAKQWGGRALWSPGTNRSAGVGILLHPRCSIEITGHKFDTAGRVASVKLKQGTQHFQCITVYAPNNQTDRAQFFDNLWRYMFRNVETIIAGDFNCIPDVKQDKWGGDDTLGDKGVTQLHALTDSFRLEDYFRVKYPK